MRFYTEDEGDIQKGHLEAVIEVDASITEPTILHAQIDSREGIQWYENGVDVVVSAIDSNDIINLESSFNGNEISIDFTQANLDEKLVKISLVPKKN